MNILNLPTFSWAIVTGGGVLLSCVCAKWQSSRSLLLRDSTRTHRVLYTEWQRPLSAVHSIMRVKLAQAGEGGECAPLNILVRTVPSNCEVNVMLWSGFRLIYSIIKKKVLTRGFFFIYLWDERGYFFLRCMILMLEPALWIRIRLKSSWSEQVPDPVWSVYLWFAGSGSGSISLIRSGPDRDPGVKITL